MSCCKKNNDYIKINHGCTSTPGPQGPIGLTGPKGDDAVLPSGWTGTFTASGQTLNGAPFVHGIFTVTNGIIISVSIPV